MSLKIRLVLILSAVLSLGIAFSAVALWLHARAAMRSEMDTTLQSAERLISALRSQPGLAGLSPAGLTEALDRLRHVRVVRPDAGPLPPENTDVAGVPRWFSRLIAPDTADLEPIDLGVGGARERVILQADPGDEIREVWEDVRILMVIAAMMCLRRRSRLSRIGARPSTTRGSRSGLRSPGSRRFRDPRAGRCGAGARSHP